MEEPIQISTLNDFIFCPRSIYFHNIYSHFDEKEYHSTPQRVGKFSHTRIDNKNYSSSKHILQGIDVFSDELGVVGKIDLFDLKLKKLIERKYLIKRIYYGYLLQIYAQYFCLIEMGYSVNLLEFRSLKDNRVYPVAIPGKREKEELISVIKKMKEFSLDAPFSQNREKCRGCIYRELCDYYAEST